MNKNLNIRLLLMLLPKGTKLYCKCFDKYVEYIGYNNKFAVIQTYSEKYWIPIPELPSDLSNNPKLSIELSQSYRNT